MNQVNNIQRRLLLLALAVTTVFTLTGCFNNVKLTETTDKLSLEVPHGKLSDLKWVPLPEFGGQEAIIYKSPDGKRVFAAFRESGKSSFTYPFDEFLYVTAGSLKVKVHGGGTFTLTKGDVAYFREGLTVDFEFSDDFEDVTFLMADHEVKWR